jgi:hypothetical protein
MTTLLQPPRLLILARWRRIRLAHGLLALGLSIATVVVLLSAPDKAWIPAMLLTASLAAGAVLHLGWWRATHAVAQALGPEERAARIREAGVRTVVHIAFALVFGAMFLSFFALGLERTALVATVAFCALAIFGGPVWLASVGDEEDAERGVRGPFSGGGAGRR